MSNNPESKIQKAFGVGDGILTTPQVTRSQSDRPAAQRSRVPFGVPRQTLAVEIRGQEKYHLHWINDTGSRIQSAEAGGYQFVMRDELTSAVSGGDPNLGDRVSKVVGKGKDGKPLIAYLMRLPREWYDADKKIIQDRCDEIDAAIKRGAIQTDGVRDNIYAPRGVPITMKRDE